MNHSLTALVTTSCLLVAATCVASAQSPAPVEVPDRSGRDGLYAWLDRLDYPDGVDLRTVRWTRHGESGLAFVVSESDDRIELFAFGGFSLRVPKAQGAGAGDDTRMEVVEFRDAAEQWLHEIQRESADPDVGDDVDDAGAFGFGNVLPVRSQLIMAARRAYRSDAGDLESRLLDAAAIRYGLEERSRGRSGTQLSALLRADTEVFERVAAWTGSGMTAGLAGKRARLLRFAELFPESHFAGPARSEADILARMIVEAPGLPTDEELESLTGESLARALVQRLRDSEAVFSINGSVSLHSRGKGSTMLDRLISMGDESLPALVDAFGDTTLTRAVSHGRWGLSPETIKVGMAAQMGVEAITGKWFATPEAARDWLLRRQAEGESTLLTEEILNKGWVDTGAIRRLVESDPAAAAQALRSLLAADMAISRRVQLISELGQADHVSIEAIMSEQCAPERPFAVRQMAAQRLGRWDPKRARSVALEILRTDPGHGSPRLPATQAAFFDDQVHEDAWRRLAVQLVELEAWDAIAAETPMKTAITRYAIGREIAARESVSTRDPAIARILLRGLVDGAEVASLIPHGSPYRGPDSRVSDLVGAYLLARGGNAAAFPVDAPREDRDRVLEEIRNRLRVSLGEEPEPTPVGAPAIPSLDDEIVVPLLKALQSADLDALEAAETKIAMAGLEALPALRRAMGRFEGTPSQRSALERGITRLGTTVNRVIFRPGGDETLGAELSKLQGRPLDHEAILAWLQRTVTMGAAVRLLIHRPAGDSGCTLVLAAGDPDQPDRLRLDGTFGQGSHRGLDDRAWQSVRRWLHSTSERPPEAGWAIRIDLR
ncbi:hypothetical protein Poly30_52180 [Planctomycetes bacterium Poly30]|uniref:HEAT repeat protein n=1 Tax=Saltatorellus ferox TaxID=2528018 RepID=A0A518EZZ7_9BACT|nr:hypothetical protein Poly30_52180 [Planctomycetes bacterium Poly30]